METIHFFKEDVELDLRTLKKHKKWLKKVAALYQYKIIELNYIFCSDQYLHQINMQYLNHDTYTDIITFDQREEESEGLEGDIFISIDRVRENAQAIGTNTITELNRVIAHGILHLIGFNDKTKEQKSEMRTAEDKALLIL